MLYIITQILYCNSNSVYIGLATEWLEILSLGGNDKISNHSVANLTDWTWYIETDIKHNTTKYCMKFQGIFLQFKNRITLIILVIAWNLFIMFQCQIINIIPNENYSCERYIRLVTKWLRILSLGGNEKTRNHLVAKSIYIVRL